MSKELAAGDLQVGDVVQIDPAHDEMFGGAFMIITEPKSWGAQGYVPMGVYMTGTEEGEPVQGVKQAFYRCPFSAMTRIGRAEWDVPREEVVDE